MQNKLESLRHSTAHLLAQAVLELFPKTKLGIGPSIENGFYYDFDIKEDFSEKDLERIEQRMKEISKKNLKIVRESKTKSEAEKILKNQPYKLELLKELKTEPTFYTQGDFADLCAGPHVGSTKEIKYFKLLKIAGAYWKGDSKNKMLQRIYGTVFEDRKELKNHLHMLEEAKKRDHKKLGEQLDLFTFHKEGPGFPFFHPKGTVIYNELVDFWKKIHRKHGYQEIKTPIILNNELWLKSGHWENYKENMYFTKIDKKDYAVKPMNCPGGILVYKSKLHSYKEFPLKLAELGLVHRHELSGVLNGLFRVRNFTQDDAHIYCTKEQLEDEIKKVINLTGDIYGTFGLKYELELSTRPEKSIGSAAMWSDAENSLKNALESLKLDYQLNPGDGAFYGPKIDFHIKDSLGRSWQCGTIQVDFSMPEKFDLEYDGSDNRKHRPVMVHRAILGSLERFLGIMIEHYAGKFPLWLSPVQVKIMNVNDDVLKYANKIKEELEENDIRVELDDRNESISKKVRDAQNQKINYMVTIGEKEVKAKKLAIRTRDGKVSFGISTTKFIKDLKKEIEDKK
ncbi:threonine--tRNA ligase [Candidatus Woesearchaeota archaeon]|jgi:threonyl-tRNA synthetase|nr:threonine--tRNA ligase [Candidatus Woesearchaeota archaeon]MBT7169727.1 threonine--tRNA ligase [Candidatus Woesearchaeota archaeon]MBT7474665.1 threonine--tRNA ligase [Candidatus Woesearchaeota archaeon]